MVDHDILENDYVALGRDVVDDGRLQKLRTRLGFSANIMAEILYINPATYRSWEAGSGAGLRKRAAERLGRFYTKATQTLDTLDTEAQSLKDLVPLHLVAAAAGLPQELLITKMRRGEFEAVDLGILGTWVHRRFLPVLGVDDQ